MILNATEQSIITFDTETDFFFMYRIAILLL